MELIVPIELRNHGAGSIEKLLNKPQVLKSEIECVYFCDNK